MRQVIYTDAKSGKKFLKIKNVASPNEKVTENEIYENFFIHLTDDVIIVCLTTAFPWIKKSVPYTGIQLSISFAYTVH